MSQWHTFGHERCCGTSLLPQKAEKLLGQEERDHIVWMLAANPECGEVIRGTSGFRKVRIAVKGRGKSGGARVIYFFYNETMPIYLASVYAQNEKANLTQGECNELRKLAEAIVEESRS